MVIKEDALIFTFLIFSKFSFMFLHVLKFIFLPFTFNI